MSSIFNAPAYGEASQPLIRAQPEEARTPPGQAARPGADATSAAPNGAGAPAATGAVAAPTGVNPVPAPAPPVSVSQLGLVAAAAINWQEPAPTAEAPPTDPANVAGRAALAYRDAFETTNGTEPGKLMIAA